MVTRALGDRGTRSDRGESIVAAEPNDSAGADRMAPLKVFTEEAESACPMADVPVLPLLVLPFCLLSVVATEWLGDGGAMPVLGAAAAADATVSDGEQDRSSADGGLGSTSLGRAAP